MSMFGTLNSDRSVTVILRLLLAALIWLAAWPALAQIPTTGAGKGAPASGGGSVATTFEAATSENVNFATSSFTFGASFTGAITGTALTVSGVTGNITIGQTVLGSGVTAGTVIQSGSGTSWVVNNSQTVVSEAMTSAVNFGTASSGRLIAVAFNNDYSGSSTGTAVTIGGVSASLAQGDGTDNNTSIWCAAVPTGTSGSIVANGTGLEDVTLVVWQMTGAVSCTPSSGSANIGIASPQPFSIPVTVPSNGVALIATSGRAGGATTTWTWTNTTASGGDGSTTTFGQGGNNGVQGGSHAITSATVTVSTSPDALSFVGNTIYASWAP